MTKKQFECPNCSAPGATDIDTIVRISKAPEARARVLSGEYFEWECESCRRRYLIDDVFLYYDDAKKFMVYYVPGYKKHTLSIPTLIQTKEGFDTDGSTLRVTNRFLDLAEKIRIFEAGLDDRVIEAVKFYCIVNYSSAGRTVNDILFEELDDENMLFFSVYDNNDCTGLPVPIEAYLRAQSDLAPFFDPPPKDAFVMVDQSWLTDILRHKSNA